MSHVTMRHEDRCIMVRRTGHMYWSWDHVVQPEDFYWAPSQDDACVWYSGEDTFLEFSNRMILR